ncbi:MAG: hypothetical protein WDN24_12615 [Sphingomonas sp.]
MVQAKDASKSAGLPARPAEPEGSSAEQNFRFYDNRQKYLMFVNTCSEKWVVADRVARELELIQPSPPAVRFFDAGMGDGTVLARVLRAMHQRYERFPFYIAGKEISLEDVRLTLDKMPDRFLEHPEMVMAVTNISYAEAPWLTPSSEEGAKRHVWKEVALKGSTTAEFERQILELQSFLAENWRTRESPKTGSMVPETPTTLVLYREDCRFLLDAIIPRQGAPRADFDLVLASQPFRLRGDIGFKARRVLAPADARAAAGRAAARHPFRGQRSGAGDHPEGLAARGSLRHVAPRAARGDQDGDGRRGRRLSLRSLAQCAGAVPLRDAHFARRNRQRPRLDRHLDPARRVERRHLCGADRGCAAGRGDERFLLSRRHPRRAAQAWRAVVQRRKLCDHAAGIARGRRARDQ